MRTNEEYPRKLVFVSGKRRPTICFQSALLPHIVSDRTCRSAQTGDQVESESSRPSVKSAHYRSSWSQGSDRWESTACKSAPQNDRSAEEG